MKIRSILATALTATLMLASCSTPKIAYMQDIKPGKTQTVQNVLDIRLRPDDKISVMVNSKDPALVNLFNLPTANRQIGSIANNLNNSQGVSCYTVDRYGNIDFPVLGAVRVEGLTRVEAAARIKEKLISENLVKDPVVTVEFANLTISVLGEVTKPGRFSIDKDRLTLLEAISMAGDLTVYGKRENVLIQRDENGKKTVYKVDLTSAEELYASPAYYLQQNDVVYVEPNTVRARQATVNGNNVRSTSFWISLASLLTSVAVLIFK